MCRLTEIVKVIGAREKAEKEKEVGQGEFPLFSPHKVALSHTADPVWEQLFCVTSSPWLASSLTPTTFRTL